MRLKKVEIYGFKSFAERVELVFDHGITGIVGPNGCGKSNISDAVRWVLGEQSAKTLRGAKMEDVIFNGTEKRRRLSYCEVVLTFDNEDRGLPIDFSEVAVSRRVYRNGDSEYMINRAACRLKDIVELFRDTGIGKEGYSLIGQGRIDEILSVKSEDRRQIFEEAAGIVKYKARKNEAERRMENTRLNLSRVEDILAELEARVEPLREQSEIAREYIALRDELKGLELNVFIERSERYTQRIAELEKNGVELDQMLLELEGRRSKAGQTREETQESLSVFEEQSAQAREQVQLYIREVETLEGAVSVLKERIASHKRDEARVNDEARAAESGEEGVREKLAALKATLAQEEEESQRDQAAHQAREQDLRAKDNRLEEMENALEEAKSELIDAMNRLSDVKSEQARLTAMRDALSNRIQSMRQDESDDAGQTEDYEARLKFAADRLDEEREEKQRLDREAASAAARVRALAENAEKLIARRGELESSHKEAASRLRVLKEMQRDYEGYYNSVKNVLLQARRLPNSGVRGVVATLLHVPKELERAIDMVLGSALQHLVVEREEDAKRMIDFLRQNRMGRATFLPIAAVKGRVLSPQERQVLSMPGCVGLASELVEFDPEYRGIAENLLGRTVIAKDLDSGIQIMRAGRHAFRLVTLEGDVMHSGGSMTGGSVQSRVTSLLSREREVAEHEQKVSALTLELNAAQEESLNMERERAELKRVRAELFESLHQQEIACAREEAHVKAAEAELNQHRSRAQRVEGERSKLEEQLLDVTNSLSALTGQQGEAEDQHSTRQQDIQGMQKALYEAREEAAALRQSVGDERAALAAKLRGLEALRADYRRLESQSGDMASILRNARTSLESILAKLASDEQALTEEERRLSDSRALLEKHRMAFQQIDGQRIGAQERLKKLNEELEELRLEADRQTESRHRTEVTLTRIRGEYKQLTDRIWEDYELSYEGAQSFKREDFKLTESEKRISQIRARIREMGSVNVAAVDEYRQTIERFEALNTQRDDLIKAELDLQGIVEELIKKMEVQFKEQFEILNQNFQETFFKLFGGGRAELKLTDPKDALNCGIEVMAQPPGKKLQMLSLLSGGERALTAIAILFAMLKHKPTPFCFLDEIEAALDDANIDNFADYLKDYSKNTQFVVVTHRKGTMERCDALYGVAMEEKGVTRLVSVKLGEAAKAG